MIVLIYYHIIDTQTLATLIREAYEKKIISTMKYLWLLNATPDDTQNIDICCFSSNSCFHYFVVETLRTTYRSYSKAVAFRLRTIYYHVKYIRMSSACIRTQSDFAEEIITIEKKKTEKSQFSLFHVGQLCCCSLELHIRFRVFGHWYNNEYKMQYNTNITTAFITRTLGKDKWYHYNDIMVTYRSIIVLQSRQQSKLMTNVIYA